MTEEKKIVKMLVCPHCGKRAWRMIVGNNFVILNPIRKRG